MLFSLNINIFIFLLIFCAFSDGDGVVQPPTVRLNDGREMPAIALGTWWGINTAADSLQPGLVMQDAVTWAIDAGYRHIDTAAIYNTEGAVGRALAEKIAAGMRREEFFICTKLWSDRHARSQVVPTLRDSLHNLQLEWVDLYLIHFPPAVFPNGTYDLTDYLETWRGMMDAKALGLTKSIGVSNFNEAMIDRILDHGLEIPTVLQVEINLNLQQPKLLSYCRGKNITVTGYTPFGALFGPKRAPGAAPPPVDGPAMPSAPPPRVNDPALVTIASHHNKTVPQVVLRYLWELGVVPLPKSTTKSRIESNIDIFDFELNEEERRVLQSFDKHYRIWTFDNWKDHPYYPFEKN